MLEVVTLVHTSFSALWTQINVYSIFYFFSFLHKLMYQVSICAHPSHITTVFYGIGCRMLVKKLQIGGLVQELLELTKGASMPNKTDHCYVGHPEPPAIFFEGRKVPHGNIALLRKVSGTYHSSCYQTIH